MELAELVAEPNVARCNEQKEHWPKGMALF